ncbi:hypothetical protein SAMN05421636_10815 [Pricia antarctica]|uniref:Uncharacterized protein n=1 Tax=Pricia antarctica TaxID=641691 RepID=A0A1G7G8C5_9FLAO|nr:hypothetical protein SAMN05421636_10815 [Pricia antarctica]
MKYFTRIIIFNLWIGSWMPFLWIAIKLSTINNYQIEWYIMAGFYVVALIFFALGWGSTIFLHKVKQHDWFKYLE